MLYMNESEKHRLMHYAFKKEVSFPTSPLVLNWKPINFTARMQEPPLTIHNMRTNPFILSCFMGGKEATNGASHVPFTETDPTEEKI